MSNPFKNEYKEKYKELQKDVDNQADYIENTRRRYEKGIIDEDELIDLMKDAVRILRYLTNDDHE